jgi:hypothetical protein
MRIPTVGHLGRLPVDARPGRREGIASLLMLPANMLLLAPLYLIGSALQGALGLEEDELLPEAGTWGWLAAVLMVALLAAAPAAGVVLGVRARRLGERRLGAVGVVANLTIGLYLVLVSAVQLLLA